VDVDEGIEKAYPSSIQYPSEEEDTRMRELTQERSGCPGVESPGEVLEEILLFSQGFPGNFVAVQ
jgi:hypothetical protein